MRRGFRLLAVLRNLTPGTLLETVRSDPGMTAVYYANRYFGKEKAMEVNHLLWTELKRHGKVSCERSDGDDGPAHWHPLMSSPRRHIVRHHVAEDEDLSVLRTSPGTTWSRGGEESDSSEPSAASSSSEALNMDVEEAVLQLVQKVPGKDIQYYINELPLAVHGTAPAAFKRLREAGLLQRESTPQGTYVWQ